MTPHRIYADTPRRHCAPSAPPRLSTQQVGDLSRTDEGTDSDVLDAFKWGLGAGFALGLGTALIVFVGFIVAEGLVSR